MLNTTTIPNSKTQQLVIQANNHRTTMKRNNNNNKRTTLPTPPSSPPQSPEFITSAIATRHHHSNLFNNNNRRHHRYNNNDRNMHTTTTTTTTFEYNNRILAAKRNGNLRVVMTEFISMKKHGVQLTQHTFNLVLEAHAILRREGTPLTTMLKIYNEMIHYYGIQPNTYTYTLMIRTLCKRDVEVQKTVAMLKRQSLRIGQYNQDVGLLESEGNLSQALAIFYSSSAAAAIAPAGPGVALPEAICFEIDIYNQLLRVLSHYGDAANANFVYGHLVAEHIKPNSATFTALINLFGRAGDIQMALSYYQVYNEVKETLGPHDTSYIFNALVDCHLKCNLLDGALDIIHKSTTRSIIPYNSIIRHYCTHGAMDQAESLILKLQQQEETAPAPDASSFGPVLAAYCQTNRFDDATRIYDQLIKTDISKAYGNLANYALLCLSHDDRPKSLAVIEDMTRANLEPDPVLAERIVTSFVHAGEFNQAIGALHTVQDAMSTRSINKGASHLIGAALSIVQACHSLRQILQSIHSLKVVPRLFEMDKALMDCYFDSAQQQELLTTKDYEVLFDAAFVVYQQDEGAAAGDVVMQLLQDLRVSDTPLPDDLYHHVLNQLQRLGDIDSESRWKAAFVVPAATTGSSHSKTDEEEDDDLIIQIADEDAEEEQGVPTTTVVTTTPPSSTILSKAEMISNEVLKCIMHGQRQEAIRIFEDRIICQGLIPSPEVMREVIAFCGKQGDLSTALTLYNNSIYAFKDIQDINAKDQAIYMATNSILIGYAQLGEMEKAKVYYDRIKAMGHYPDSNGYASLLLGSAKKSSSTDEATDALVIYEEAKRHHVQPTTFFYNVVISKLAKARKLDAALTLFDEMKMFMVPANSITYGAIISASVRSGSEAQSRRLFGEMESAPGYQPRVGPFNNMMQFYVRQSPNRDRVLEYFAELRKRKIKPSPHSYKLLMEAYTHIAPYDMPTAHNLLTEMQACDKIRPQATHYATLIYSYGLLQRDVQLAERVFLEMKKAKVLPDEAVYQAMIDTLISNDQLEKAEQIHQEQQKQQRVTTTTYIENLFIRGYGQQGQLEKAEQVFENMVDSPPPPSSAATMGTSKVDNKKVVVREPSTYEAMIRAYLENDQPDKAQQVLEKMIQRDFPAKVINAVADLCK